MYGFSTGIPFNIFIVYGKDPNFNKYHTMMTRVFILQMNTKYEL